LNLFAFGDAQCRHCIDCCLFSGVTWGIQVSSPVKMQFLAFKNLITDRISQLAGFSIFILISRQNDKLINKE
jgi:hypothetical protein